MSELPQAAAAWVFDEHGRLLLIKENYDRRRFPFPKLTYAFAYTAL